MLDLIIKGGTVVDGTGRQGVNADIGVGGDRITAIGAVDEPAAKVINADGLVVAPGFIDVHTHYDAQVFWDPSLSPSPLHGVTTAIGGNCGFTIAPIADEHADYLVRMLALVEGMPLESLREGVPWGTWKTFGEWLNTFAGSLAINAGFMVGHSTIRRLAMGEDAYNPNPTEAQLKTMETYLRDSLGAGGLGFSSSNGRNHLDGDHNPVPSRWADDEEYVRLASVVREFPGDEPRVHPPERGGERRGPDDRHVQGGPAAHQLERARGDRSPGRCRGERSGRLGSGLDGRGQDRGSREPGSKDEPPILCHVVRIQHHPGLGPSLRPAAGRAGAGIGG